MLLKMAAPDPPGLLRLDRETDPPGIRQPDREPDRRREAGKGDREGPDRRREDGAAPDIAGPDRRQEHGPTPDPPGLLRLDQETNPPGLHQPDQKPGQDRGPLPGEVAPGIENGIARRASRTGPGTASQTRPAAPEGFYVRGIVS